MLGAVIGAGGFAVVVRARDESLDTDVAIKILRGGSALDLETRTRFLQEARLLRRVRHPSVVTVHDIGETDDGRPYLVMDVAEGGTLGDRLGTVILPPDPADLTAVVTTLSEGLGALHDAGVVHRDVKPANLLVLHDGSGGRGVREGGRLLAPGERLVIGDLGLAKDQLVTAYGPTMLGGTPGYMAPEQSELGARIDRRTDVYGATAVLWLVVTGAEPPSREQVTFRVRTAPEAWRPVFESGLAEDPINRFADMGEWAAAATRAIASTSGLARATTLALPVTAALPYKGLAAFDSDDAALFFGRRELVDHLVARLQQHTVLVVGGPSGSGKSSLVRAGLIPALAGGALGGSERWPVRVVTPGPTPQADFDEDGARVIVVDQLEELFTLCDDEARRVAFLDALEQASSRARVVVAVRADFYGACAAYPWLANAITANHVLVGPMTEAQLRDVIVGPARAVGLQVEGALVDRIVADAGTDAGALPLIAHALVETWLRRDDNRLTLAGYEEAGGVGGAIGRTADEVWQGLDEDDQERARRLFLRLVHPGEGTPDTKRFLAWSEAVDNDAVRRVVSRFADARLLTLDDRGIELAHEALIRAWDRLAAWLDESRDELRTGVRIADAAREWEAQGRDPDLLYRGARLSAALEWRDGNDDVISEPTASFLTVSAEREARAHRVRRRAVITLAGLTAVAIVAVAVAGYALRQARRDERAAKTANERSSIVATKAVGNSADNAAERDPYLATALAVESIFRSNSPPLPAREALVKARAVLAGDALVPLGDPVPVGDAVAVAVRPDGEVFATGERGGGLVVRDTKRGEVVARLRGPSGSIEDVTFTSDGNWLVAASADKRLWRWQVTSGSRVEEKGQILDEPGARVWSVAAAPAGATIAATTGAGEVVLIDVPSARRTGPPLQPGGGELLSVTFAPGNVLLAGSGSGVVYGWTHDRRPAFAPLAAHTSEVWQLVPMPDGNGFATVSSDGSAKVWDTAGLLRFTAQLPDVPLLGGTVGPDGDSLVLGGGNGALYGWSVERGQPVGAPTVRHRDRVTTAARSADRRLLVTLSDDQTVRLWTQRPRPSPLVVFPRAGNVRSLAVSRDGQSIAVGGDDGTVRILTPDGVQRVRLTGHTDAVRALAFTTAGVLITGDASGTVRAWDVKTGRRLRERAGAHLSGVSAIDVEEELFTGGADGHVRRWRASDLSPREDLGRLTGTITDVDVGPDGRVAASSQGGEVGRWDASGDRVGVVLRVNKEPVWGVAIANDTVLASTHPETLARWRPFENSRPNKLAVATGHEGGAQQITTVADTTAAVVGRHGSLYLWDIATATPIGDPVAFAADTREAWFVAAAPDGTLWLASTDGDIARYDGLSLDVACAIAGDSFGASQRERFLGDRRSRCDQ